MNRRAVTLKSNPYGLILDLSPELPFEDLLCAVEEKFRASADFFRNSRLALTFRGRTLTEEQERLLIDVIADNSPIEILCIADEREETAEYYREAQVRAAARKTAEEGQFYYGSVQDGELFETETGIIIVGDVMAGGEVISCGNIVVLGSCRGKLHAGAGGNVRCFAAALSMKPAMVKIADRTFPAAVDAKNPEESGENASDARPDPQIVYIEEEHLKLSSITGETLGEYLSRRMDG